MEVVIFFGIILFVAVLLFGVGSAFEDYEKEKYGEEEYKRRKKVAQEYNDREKYCDYMISCPVCKSKKVKRISTSSRVVSVAMIGLASSKIGKQYECDSCHHKW